MATPFRLFTDYALRMAGTRRRLHLRELVAGLLTAVEPDEVEWASRLLIGKAFPAADNRALRMNASAIWRVVEPIFGEDREALARYTTNAVDFGAAMRALFAQAPRQTGICPEETQLLTLPDVYGALTAIANLGGVGVRAARETVLRELLCRADPDEAMLIVKNVIGEMRHGVNEGMLLEGIARAAGADQALVQRAFMLLGDAGELARIALTEGVAALAQLDVAVFTPLRPMLAQAADDVSAAWAKHGDHLALEYKLDGARVQIHRRGDEVRIYTRHLMEVTASLPDVADAVRAQTSGESLIVEGEVVAVDAEGRAQPFQELMRRFRRLRDVPRLLHEVPVRLYLFDILYQDGIPLLDYANSERWELLTGVTQPGGLVALVPRLLPATVEEGTHFFEQAIDQGHEGLLAKRLDSTYSPGMRGAGWLKIKEAITVDLVITAAEWGYGRRTGWLSNYHLAARDIVSGTLVMVGKTFKGLTDEEFRAMTEALMDLQTGVQEQVVEVRPEVVVEVAFNQIQSSTTYPGGVTLRFARIVRFRPDKSVDDIDTLQTLRDIYTMQTGQDWRQAA